MKIETFVNFKLRNGRVLVAGFYDDSNKAFADELYEEIEKHKNGFSRKLRIISKTPAKPKEEPKSKEEPKVETMNTMDSEEEVLETDSKSKKKTTNKKPRARKTTTKKTTKKKEE